MTVLKQKSLGQAIRPLQFNILFLIQWNIKNQCGRAALFTNIADKTQHVISQAKVGEQLLRCALIRINTRLRFLVQF